MTLSSMFSIIFFIAFAIYALLAIYILFLNMKSMLNRIFFILCISLCIWTFGYSIANSAPDYATAYFWRRLAVLGWGPMFSILLHYLIILTNRIYLLKRSWLYVLLYLPAVVTVFVFGLYGDLAAGQYNLVSTAAGWINISTNNMWDRFFNLYYVTYAFISIWLLWDWGRKSPEAQKMKQARLLIFSFAVVIILGTATDILTNINQQYNLPQIASLSILFPVSVIFYFIKRHGLMNPQKIRVNQTGMMLSDVNLAVFYQIISVAFLLGSILNFASQYFFYQAPLPNVLIFSSFLFIYGIIFQIIRYFQPKAKIQENIFIFLLSASVPLITLKFVATASVTIWVLPFLFLILSVVYKKRMLLWLGASILITQIWVWLKTPTAMVPIDSSDHLVRIGLFAIALWLTYYINGVFLRHFKENEAQIRFQKVVSQISSSFVKVTPSNLQEKINAMLQLSGEFFMVDRTFFISFSSNLPTQEWCNESLEAATNIAPLLNDHDYPWWMKLLLKNDVVHIEDVEFLPLEAASEQELLRQYNIKSLLAITVTNKDKTLGYLFFASVRETRNWRKDHQELLRILANILSDALIKVEAEKEISYMAYYDSLTGLPNRSLFKNRLEKEIHSTKKTIAVMFIDLDSFKAINDTMGHDGGDEILILLTSRLSGSLRPTDTLSRFGGDEFLILLTQIERIEDIQIFADDIMNTLAQPLTVKDQEFFITASAGIAVYPSDGEDADVLIKNADLAMYASKEKGKNQYTICTQVMKEEVLQKMKLTNSLYRALERNELMLYYQPQVSVSTQEITGFETLIRWNHPELGIIPPISFISLAEQTGLIHPIGQWVLKTACRQNREWQQMGLPALRIAVNLSIEQFRNPNLVNLVATTLNETGLKPECLELEITEGMAVREANYFIEVLHDLKKLGVTIALDDFGTEYSSLSRLKTLPVDRIKVDMHFVHGISAGNKDEAITKTIIQLAKNLKLKVLAEGVETAEQFAFFSQQMCDDIQGFYFYKPMPAADIEALLPNHFHHK